MAAEIHAADRVALSRYLLGQLTSAEADLCRRPLRDRQRLFRLVRGRRTGARSRLCVRGNGAADAAFFERNYLVTGERRQQVKIVQALLAVQAERRPAHAARFSPARKWVLAFALIVISVAIGVLWEHRRPSDARRVAASQVSPGASATIPEKFGLEAISPVRPAETGPSKVPFRAVPPSQDRIGKQSACDARSEPPEIVLS